MRDQVLEDYFKFDESDLAANRTGKFSEKQKQKLEEELNKSISNGMRIAIISIVLAVIFLALSVLLAVLSISITPLWGWIIGTGILMLICGAIGILALRRASIRKKISKNLSEDITKVEGPISIEHARSSEDCFLYIGKEEFDITEKITTHMKDGDTYAIYYEIGDRTILSVELISPR